MKNLLALITVLLLTSCGTTYRISTLNHDPIYGDENYVLVIDDVKVDTLNEFQFRNRLRTDFQLRYDYAQYALSQPRSFDWNNKLLRTRYNWNRPYYGYGGYNHYWNRTEMWNDWVWGYTGWDSWGSPHRWSPFGYDRWGYGIHYGWNNHGWSYSWNNRRWSSNQWGNPYGWNNYYGWNNGFYNRYRGINVAYHTGRRGSVINQRRVTPNRTNSVRTTPTRTNNVTPTNVRSSETRVIKNRRPKTIIPPVRTNDNNIRPVRTNTRPTYNNSRPVRTNTRTNNRPTYNNSRPVRGNTTTTNRSRPTTNSNSTRKRN